MQKINYYVASSIDGYRCGPSDDISGFVSSGNKQIDLLTVKLNPLIQGQGVRLFGNSNCQYKLELISNIAYENSLQIIQYKIRYE